jgi:hypothetical protein
MIRLLTPGPDGTPIADGIDVDDPSLISELLRLDGPVQATARTATQDQRVGYVEIACGEPALVAVAAANRDPDVFTEADQFRPIGPLPAEGSLLSPHQVRSAISASRSSEARSRSAVVRRARGIRVGSVNRDQS